MRNPLVLAAVFCLLSWPLLQAGPMQTITLKDQTIVRGEVVAMQNGTYTVKTKAMGNVTITADQVLSIVSDDAASATPAPTAAPTGVPRIREGGPRHQAVAPRQAPGPRKNRPGQATASQAVNESAGQETGERAGEDIDYSSKQQEVNGRVQSMMMNKGFAENVTTLSDANEMEDVLNDPETMQQIQNFDYGNLMNNDKIKKLMDSNQVQQMLGNFGATGKDD